jgi:hypothetical protein
VHFSTRSLLRVLHVTDCKRTGQIHLLVKTTFYNRNCCRVYRRLNSKFYKPNLATRNVYSFNFVDYGHGGNRGKGVDHGGCYAVFVCATY